MVPVPASGLFLMDDGVVVEMESAPAPTRDATKEGSLTRSIVCGAVHRQRTTGGALLHVHVLRATVLLHVHASA